MMRRKRGSTWRRSKGSEANGIVEHLGRKQVFLERLYNMKGLYAVAKTMNGNDENENERANKSKSKIGRKGKENENR